MKRTFTSLMAALSLALVLPVPAFSAGATIELDNTVDTGEVRYESYFEDFESGVMPEGFHEGADSARPWKLDSTQSKSGSLSLRSGVIDHNQTSSVALDTDLPAGTLSFDYLELTESCCDVMELRINGKRYNFRKTGVSNQWQHIEVLIPNPTRRVEFTYRKDPVTIAREDAVWIDNIEFTDTISPTADANDPDGDGIPYDVEQQYAALDPYDADDGFEDYDNDGASNLSEINSGYSPDVANIFVRKNLFAFYPLGDISWDYRFSNGYIATVEGQSLSAQGRFRNDSSGGYEILERREDGIYIMERGINDTDGSQTKYVYHQGLLKLPRHIRLGEDVYSTTDLTMTLSGGETFDTRVDVIVSLLEEYQLLSSSSSADTLMIGTSSRALSNSGDYVYGSSYQLLGLDVGTLAFLGDAPSDLVDMRVARIDNSIAGQASTSTSDKAVSRTTGIQSGGGGGGGGSTSLLFTGLLTGLLIWRRRMSA